MFKTCFCRLGDKCRIFEHLNLCLESSTQLDAPTKDFKKEDVRNTLNCIFG